MWCASASESHFVNCSFANKRNCNSVVASVAHQHKKKMRKKGPSYLLLGAHLFSQRLFYVSAHLTYQLHVAIFSSIIQSAALFQEIFLTFGSELSLYAGLFYEKYASISRPFFRCKTWLIVKQVLKRGFCVVMFSSKTIWQQSQIEERQVSENMTLFCRCLPYWLYIQKLRAIQ